MPHPIIPAKLLEKRNEIRRLTKKELYGRINNEPRPPSYKLEPPDWITADATVEWNRLVAQFREMDKEFLSDLDLTALGIYCEYFIIYKKAMQKVRESSEVITCKNDPSKPMKNPWLIVANDAAMVIKKYGQMLCLDPASRARFGFEKTKNEADPMKELGFDV